MIQIDPIPLYKKFIAVKRKATEDPSIDLKRLKFVASSNSSCKTDLKRILVDEKPALKDVDFEIEDYEQFVLKEKESSFPKKHEVITCNGIPLVPASALPKEPIGETSSDESEYVYDLYLYDPLVSESFRDHNSDDEYSSNDEEHPYNEYPDEDECDENETDFYRSWEDDDCRDMMRDFEKNCLGGDSDDDDLYDKED